MIVQVLGSSLESELGFLSQINNNNLLKILVNYIKSVCFLESGISSFYSNSQVHRINLHATLRLIGHSPDFVMWLLFVWMLPR